MHLQFDAVLEGRSQPAGDRITYVAGVTILDFERHQHLSVVKCRDDAQRLRSLKSDACGADDNRAPQAQPFVRPQLLHNRIATAMFARQNDRCSEPTLCPFSIVRSMLRKYRTSHVTPRCFVRNPVTPAPRSIALSVDEIGSAPCRSSAAICMSPAPPTRYGRSVY